jgi:uncharacterized protein (TIGR01319 family)
MMPYTEHIGIDIGSTWTKGALFLEYEDRHLELIERFEQPTVREDVSDACISIYQRLRAAAVTQEPNIGFSSSAHGGLSIISIGLVPSFTERLAKEAALSAGAKLVHSIAYRISREDIQYIEDQRPDIILFTGGTDGGNRGYILENARALADLKIPTVMIYAGNRDVAPAVKTLISEARNAIELICCDNIMPVIEEPELHEVREVIKTVFMGKIIQGKGLQRACEVLQSLPTPTPGSVFELVERLSDGPLLSADWGLLDIGGATTDCYTAVKDPILDQHEGIPVFHRGISPQRISRSVEGDLGMRLNAMQAAAWAQRFGIPDPDGLRAYAEEVTGTIERIPLTAAELVYERRIASLCSSLSFARHAGSLRPIYTPEGLQYMQQGKNLTSLKELVISGGVVRTIHRQGPELLQPGLHEPHAISLVPRTVSLWYDEAYIVPLLAHVRNADPGQVRHLLFEHALQKVDRHGEPS